MRVLLDTHAVIFVMANRAALSPAVVAILQDQAADVLVSAASIYEIELKRRRGKLPAAIPSHFLADLLAGRYLMLPVSPQHAHLAAALPDVHRDPWDRILAAQALSEGLDMATKDAAFADFGVTTIW